ncbi:MAG: hypothetical protein Q9162_003819 [Coniocarpon cinnabarinum]
MLDPLSSLNLASSVITAVDFASKIVRGTIEIRRSTTGSTVTNHDIELVTLDFENVLNGLSRNNLSVSSSEDDVSLRNLAKSAHELAEELMEVLRNLKTRQPHRKWESISKAVVTAWSGKKLREYAARLNNFQSSLTTRLVYMLS